MGIAAWAIRVLPCNLRAGVAIVCSLSVLAAFGEEPAIVFEDDAVIVSEEGDTVIVDEDADQVWKALPVELHDVEGEQAYIRQSTDAFVDPDDPLNLEPNYYFVLEEIPWSVEGNFSRGDASPGESISLGRRARGLSFADAFPLPDNLEKVDGDLHLEWLDMQVGPLDSRRVLAALYIPDESAPAQLVLLRLRKQRGSWNVDRVSATKELPAGIVAAGKSPGSLLDTYNPPDELGGARVFFSKIIAVLVQVDGRYAIEFNGDSLRDTGVCRVMLTPVDHPLGKPVDFRFVEIPIARQDDRVSPATVLAVVYENADGERTAIAVDYPLASTPLMVQMRQLVSRDNNRGGEDDTEDRLTKLLGQDLVDELSRRLVNAQY